MTRARSPSRRPRLAVAALAGLMAAETAGASDGRERNEVRHDPMALIHAIGTSRRPSRAESPEQRANASVIFEIFHEMGHSPALALAAVANAWAESLLDHRAVMDDPFTYRGQHYPTGSGAIGLFQLLPMPGAAGGPSGRDEGLPYDFASRRFAGTRDRARQHHTAPDPRGRTYYDATDPVTNTLRIVLEIQRDGARLLEADRQGASIAELAQIFADDILRPGCDTQHRRRIAMRLFGPELAVAAHPNRLLLRGEAAWRPTWNL